MKKMLFYIALFAGAMTIGSCSQDEMLTAIEEKPDVTQPLTSFVSGDPETTRTTTHYKSGSFPFYWTKGDHIWVYKNDAADAGSTGYNMSAGGPIVKPDAKLMVMTPVSPYSLSRRSVIFGMDDVIRLELTEKRKDVPNTAIVSFDGAETVPVNVGESVTIRMSEHKINLIKLDVSSVYEILRRKLGG